jgi:hypothetical protein
VSRAVGSSIAREGRVGPASPQNLRIAGAARGVSTSVQANDTWTVTVLANMDPPIGERMGAMIFDMLTGR